MKKKRITSTFLQILQGENTIIFKIIKKIKQIIKFLK